MNNENRWKQRFENFEKSFNLFCRRQKEYEKNPENEGYQMALVKSYEILLELSRNTIKDYLEDQGYDKLEGPRKLIRQAFQAEIITSAEGWMEAIKKRNQTVHVYHSEVLNTILEFINNTWFPLVRDLYYYLKKEIDSVD